MIRRGEGAGREARIVRGRLLVTASVFTIVCSSAPSRAADLASPKLAPAAPTWTGFYLGGNLGLNYAAAPYRTAGTAGSVNLQQTIDTFDEAGSFALGIHAGYNYMLPNRVLLGVEGDATFPAYPNLNGFGTGGATNLFAPAYGFETLTDKVLAQGTMRGRIGYAPGSWLYYATGGLAWSREQLTMTQYSTGAVDLPYLSRLGWVVGAGVEAPLVPHWTARIEYLFSDYGRTNSTFPTIGQTIGTRETSSQVRAGLEYHFDDTAKPAPEAAADAIGNDRIAFHGQGTFTAQGYPAIRSPYQGDNSFPGGGQGAETIDATLYGGLRLWKNAEFWINPEIDQGFGLGNTHGAAGFPSGESYKLGASFPYARVQRYFVRDTINLGGEAQSVDSDINQFSGSQTANRLVLTVGKFSIVDLFDTNKYANNPKTDFLNWAMINAGTFDYAGDAWGYTYGAAAELYLNRFAFRAGVFDLSATPAGGADNAAAYGLDPTFRQVQAVGEIEERHTIGTQPGKLKLTGFVSIGRAGLFQDALNYAAATGTDASDALAAVRRTNPRPGVSLNLEQQVTDSLGAFARIGWADGNVEPWDFTDIDRTLSGGLSIAGKSWNRPDDTIGIAGILNGLAPVHAAYFQAGGNGILIGDGLLPNVQLEEIFETYYSYSISPLLKVSFDYQFIDHPAYNPQRGPVNVGTIRVHAQF